MYNKILNHMNNQGGQVSLFIVTVVMSLLLFVGLFLANTTIKQIKITRNIYKSVQAYYLADAGAELILYKFKKDNLDPNTAPLVLLDEEIDINSSFKVEIINASPLKIKSTGIYQEIARTVELSW